MALVRARRFISLTYPHLLCMEYMVQSSRKCAIAIRTWIDGDVWELNGPHFENFQTSPQEGGLSLSAQTHNQAVPVVVWERSWPGIGKWACIQEEKGIYQEITVPVGAYQPVILHKFIAIYTGIDSSDPFQDGKNLRDQAAQLGFERLYQDHCARWDERWRNHRGRRREMITNPQACDLAYSQG